MDKRDMYEKVIRHNEGNCPDFNYENPLLDKNVAVSLSRGFLNILRDSDFSEDQRSIVLQNIRNSCKVEPTGHLKIDDNVTELVRGVYEEHLGDNNINKELDSFLMRNLKEMNINTAHPTFVNPDIIKALINLKGKHQKKYDTILKDIIYWNIDEKTQSRYIDILKPMWNKDFMSRTEMEPDDISIKIKPLIENLLLTCSFEMLASVIIDAEEWFYRNKDLMQLVEVCSFSSVCFQICCSIMNSLFISSNFDRQLCKFIELFIDFIKDQSTNICQLYPPNIQHIVLLMDINLDNLNGQIKKEYIESTIKQLKDLHKDSENCLIMLLSHYKTWFDLYYSYQQEN